ncbi:sensor histidine kinase [Amycolatopsis acidicola]|uniref:sensor histidine kinase n=1 Tax=Amycolatopsis acidicola TaxID=2596893 RepID=UPI001FB5BA6D|nr:HAMP domain-containing sensor histidine kinase [Amycolatopsis acidicola]
MVAVRDREGARSTVERRWRRAVALTAGVSVVLGGIAALRCGLAKAGRRPSSRESQRRFAANASHELRTPVSVQRTLVDVAMAEAGPGTEIHRLGGQLLAANERIERVVEGLLMLARADEGPAEREPVRLDEVAGRVLGELAPSAAARGVTLSRELSPKTVAGEGFLVERLLVELVRNAIQYNVDGGVVRVRVGREVVVENTGPVVVADAVAGLFEPFRRACPDRTSHGDGAGLGLAIVRSIALAHGGSVRAEPGVQGGLRVTVRLAPARHWAA